jgi:hypothetical protein
MTRSRLSRLSRRLCQGVATLLVVTAALAAQPDPAALEPAVDTSAAPRPAPAPAAAPAASATAPAAAAKAPARPPAAGARPGAKSADRVDLEATQITGNRELPRVMYVVPWKKSDPGDLGGRPAKSLLDEVLAPVDRDVFQRQNRYYDALKPDARPADAAAAPGNEAPAR